MSGFGGHVLAVTSALAEALTYEEIRALLATQFSLLKRGEGWTFNFAFLAAEGWLAILRFFEMAFLVGGEKQEERDANPLIFLVKGIVLPLAAVLVRVAVPKSVSLRAHREAVSVCDEPFFLADAVTRMSRQAERCPLRGLSPATAHAWMFFPLPQKGFECLFNVQPALHKRLQGNALVDALRQDR